MSIARHHAEWLSLLDISGPFLSLKVLTSAFPQGLDAPDADVARDLRLAYEEWLDSAFGTRPDPDIHRTWVAWVLGRMLELPEAVLLDSSRKDAKTPREDRVDHNLGDFATLREIPTVKVPEYGEELHPDFVIAEPDVDGKLRMLVQVVPAGQDLEKALAKSAWQASPATRMMTLLRGAGVRLGLLTNGEQWMLVDRPADENMATGFASWYARLWLDEPLTLRAFRTLLGAHRLFGVPDKETIEALLSASANDRQEVTDQLGYQVRRAIELLVQAIDLADQNESRALLHDVPEAQLYEAAITVMMRLVFLLFAEEQNLMLLGDDIYDRHYAVSTLLETLRESADRLGEEVLERRFDAWSRLLAIFRAVYGGFRHDRLSMPAYGGRLFDPDRFAFLEGRTQRTSWHETPADPLPISNRVVLHLLEALQILRMRVREGAPVEARRLSFRALDIEQIGHVYEGLLDHTALRATEPVLGLAGTRDQEPEIPLHILEEISRKDAKTQRDEHDLGDFAALREDSALISFLQEQTGRSASALKKAWAAPLDAFRATLLRASCGNDEALYARVLPLAGLVRDDDYGRPIVIPAGSVYVTAGAERRATGTHYTPRSLTEPIVQHTLEPLVYVGPAEGKPREEWTLRPAADLLKLTVCDMAMGSGAFLVQACRYLSERLLEAWAIAEEGIGDRVSGIGDNSQKDVAHGIADIPRFGRVAEEHGSGGGALSSQQAVAEGGIVRPDEPAPASGGLSSGEHRGGLWEAASQGVYQPPVDRARLAARDRNTPTDRGTPGISDPRTGGDSLGIDTGSRSATPGSDPLAQPAVGDREAIPTPYTLHPTPSRRRLVTPDGFPTLNPDEAIPADPDERLVFARRLVADRCLYGVDKNPLAVEMAKLSLWLITLAKGQPFSFLDHALRCGDSLLGISDIGQLTHWSLRVSRKDAKTQRDDDDLGAFAALREQQMSLIAPQVEEALEVALRERRKIAGTRVREARDADLKAGWLATADAALALVRLGADLLVAAALHPDPNMRQAKLKEWLPRYSLLLATAEDTRAGKLTVGGQAPGREEYAALRREAEDLLAGRRPFHWPLEFPEIFVRRAVDEQRAAFDRMLEEVKVGTLKEEPARTGFAAIVGNPPFMGGSKITGALGVFYRDYLVQYLAYGKRGLADLCAYFFLRASNLVQFTCATGLLATNSLAQGDTREVALEQLIWNGFVIIRAIPSRPWPGVAGVDVAIVWLHRGKWKGLYVLDEHIVHDINSYLTSSSTSLAKPNSLKANTGKSSAGVKPYGQGFVLSPEQANALILRDDRNSEVLFPYLNGEDFNSHPEQSPSRWIINFFNWPLERAEKYPDCLQIVRLKVKAEREQSTAGPAAREKWWQYERRRQELFEMLKSMTRVLVITQVTKYHSFVFVPTNMVFDQRLIVVLTNGASDQMTNSASERLCSVSRSRQVISAARYHKRASKWLLTR